MKKIDWSKYSTEELWEIVRTVPQNIAGPWHETIYDFWNRRDIYGESLVSVWKQDGKGIILQFFDGSVKLYKTLTLEQVRKKADQQLSKGKWRLVK